MKHDEIKIGCLYVAKIAGQRDVLRVISIHERRDGEDNNHFSGYFYRCVSVKTKKEIVIKSSQKFREQHKEV